MSGKLVSALTRVAGLKRRHWGLLAIFAALLWVLTALIFWSKDSLTIVAYKSQRRIFGQKVHRMPQSTRPSPLPARVPCIGPRGRLIPDNPDDQLQFTQLDNDYPIPFLGSQQALGLEKTWITADARYGPYGFGEDDVDSNNRSKVDWDGVDWGKLQNQCNDRNAHRFPQPLSFPKTKDDVRFSLLKDTKMKNPTPQWNAFNNTRRTALVLRAYSSLQYKPQVMWHIRSIISEAALQTGGEYTVVLLVHMQDTSLNIFQSPEHYQAAFVAAKIPREFQSIAVLWDDSLLESWYKKVDDHRTEFQVNQPLQLFALHYPEFDHYWQLEIDQRFTGDAGKYFDAVGKFARDEPRKQALERSTFTFDENLHGTYANFTASVNAANNGKSRAWGPVSVPNIEPIGPKPPVSTPQEDDFTWGVGEDADVVTSSFCADIRDSVWVYKNWFKGLAFGERTPRWFCPPAVSRVSRSLALAVHETQHKQGVRIGSESVFPTWALWLGLKLSYPPQPAYMRPHEPDYEEFKEDTYRDPAKWLDTTEIPWFGFSPEQSKDGVSHGNPQANADRGLTWWWVSVFPNKVMDVWLGKDVNATRWPSMLAARDGKVYIPNFALHPVKV